MRPGIAGVIGAVVALSLTVFAQSGRKITGVVVDSASQRPVVNADVGYRETGGATQATTTDSKGRFEFTDGVAGVVAVEARRYATAWKVWPPRTGRELRFELYPPARVEGTMVDMATGASVDGYVTMYVRSPASLVNNAARVRGGVFRFDDLPPGPAVVVAHAYGFSPYFGALTIDAGKNHSTRVGLVLESVASGLVVDANDDPVDGARVRVGYDRSLPGGGYFASFSRGQATTRSEGEFEIRGLVPDTPIALQAELRGRRSDVVTITVGPGMARRDLVLRLP